MLNSSAKAVDTPHLVTGLLQLEDSWACYLLKTTSLPISDVTQQSGYPLTSNLSMVFKKTYGLSMRQYRKLHNSLF